MSYLNKAFMARNTCSDPASKFSAWQAVKHWISTGIPAKKMILGIPSFGYAYTLKSNKLTETKFSGDSKKTSHLFQSTTGVPPKAGKTANVEGDKDACGNFNPPGGQWLFKELSGTKKLTSNAKKGEKTEAKAPKKKGKEVGLKLIERIKCKQAGKDKDFYPTTLTSFEPEAVDGIVPPSGPGTQSTISPSDFRTKTSHAIQKPCSIKQAEALPLKPCFIEQAFQALHFSINQFKQSLSKPFNTLHQEYFFIN
ncbi:hypothetical protein PPACK8108_LOCUS17537 [Phakopsora pachyrhizi]|uniref:GH18 domain-containing protein n=1 Tax=Phakopsora pachyrhizi TaxID=170000 RepID=A0AAV0BDJ6_PHAPC|nr:hypothetical protein PPACK8108_LOCUS17537 [Phakopsora pachyrhizi]